jgi:chemotaxis protein methyltransferase CheR
LIYKQCGIHLHDGKKELVRARLAKRLRQTGHKNFSNYYDFLVKDPSGEELVLMLNAISTNLTSFFRESKHFDFLMQDVFPMIRHQIHSSRSERIHVWSAGCSTGEEPYSLAISFLEYFGAEARHFVKILATDISTHVLSTAASGVYSASRVENVPQNMLRKYFQKGHGKMSGYIRLKPEIRKMIEFRRFNLKDPFPSRNRYHIVFCRNVMIYFDKSFQETLVNKYHDSLKTGGYFFIGHSESLMKLNHRFKYVNPTVYLKTGF